MIAKQEEKIKAIGLRKNGLSYREILQQIPVAKSSLSLWLKSVNLTTSQKQRLTDKKLASALRGAMKRKDARIALTKEIKDKARNEIGKLSERELWLIGISLYWAEGSKEKEYRPGSRVVFSNSDPHMIKVFLRWLLEVIKISEQKIYFAIYIHESHKNRLEEVKNYWQTKTGFPIESFKWIYFKKNKINTKRRNIGNTYFGLLRVMIVESSTLNRKIQGWTEGIYGNL
ncbi:MAG: hypothetical protein A3A98_03555 [Candidatus Staskawiczbacteria bacterium RIFCSPLOWO2_01_FULL_40_39]|uniref:Uncharacterized protein n=1 Tax=Candidatus Staskawiczbacteria bacterium RIFCSPHIGHO2_01_FULL_39_25 TaxID=1802202 RepID=A0A1G2HQ76_9BACT|nr:MAG: hypothetical protein A2730_02825 [Candidatus Staskawiczbacteria bacterium RIFCSPHIGHO2_01_FULL_39_25]OGZ72888.1 MAG: hypothetical protein A3A98_03555 [Candidatus Staskawiczbacteria bacterium RIFCSPLOWO2_01_FULL_40_39]